MAEYTEDNRGLALVVDDEPTNRLILKSLLSRHGFDVIQAEDGQQAVQVFTDMQPDIIFMDVMMPNMDGYEATRQIKSISGERFVPIIFLTAMTDEEALVKCIAAGGDDFLNKPFSKVILNSKIQAMERFSKLHNDVSSLVQVMHREEEIAEGVFNSAVIAGNVADEHLNFVIKPAGTFSGDMLLTEYSPSGDLHIMLGDFTGHGLAAALGAIPTSEVFRAMTRKGFTVEQILSGINSKLSKMLPTGMFVAIQFVAIDHELGTVSIYNCGMPDVLYIDGQTNEILERCQSNNLPLGISGNLAIAADSVQRLPFVPGNLLLLSSDGLIEAENKYGEAFGQQRLESAIHQKSADKSCMQTIMDELESFTGNASQNDDISVIEVPMSDSMIELPEHEIQPESEMELSSDDSYANTSWSMELKMSGKRLTGSNPVPVLLGHLNELEDLASERQALFTVLTELFVNALDHGVLRLDSSLKQTPGGFATYFEQREKRLATLEDGYVNISLHTKPHAHGGSIRISIEDSGDGFDFTNYATTADSGELLSGRGIKLLLDLCDSVVWEAPGNRVTAVYSWKL